MRNFTKGLVSIIMPAYNAGLFISQSIESVLCQSYTNWELIIVEDCSVDNTQEILSKLNHPNINVIYNETNKGPGFNCRKAIEYARGEFITRLDSDDIFTDNRLLEQVVFFDKNPDYVLICGNAEYITIDDEVKGNRNSVYNCEKLKWKLLFKNPIISSTVMFRNEIAYNNHIEFNDNYLAEDYEFWSQLLQHGKGAMVANIWLKYRINPNGLSLNNEFEMNKNAINVSYNLIDKLLPINKERHESLLKWYNDVNKQKDTNFELYKLILKKYSSGLSFGNRQKFYMSNLIFRNFFQRFIYKLISF